MFDSQVLAFTLVVLTLTLTPGADTMLVVKNGTRSGSPAGWATTFGILGGTLLHAVVSALRLSIVLAQSTTIFQFIKLLGVLYLVWLGLQALRKLPKLKTYENLTKLAIWTASKEGLITNPLNPKVAIFYLACLPQLVSLNDPVLAKSLLLAGIHNLLSLIWLSGLVVVIGQGKRWIEKRSVQLWLSRVSGLILIGLGVRLALEER